MSVTMCTIMLVFLQCIVLWILSPVPEDRLLVSFDCKNRREINIYVDSFCDYRTIPCYEVIIDGEIVKKKYSINLSFDCSTQIRKRDFVTKWDESNAIVTVFYKDKIVLFYDFAKRTGWPSPSGGDRGAELVFKKQDARRIPHE